MLNIHYAQPSGNMILTAGNDTRAEIAEGYREGGYYGAESVVREYLYQCHNVDFIRPEVIGALTDAPILAVDPEYPDYGEGPIPFGDDPVFWFPDYAVRDPWEELKNRGRVVFQRAA